MVVVMMRYMQVVCLSTQVAMLNGGGSIRIQRLLLLPEKERMIGDGGNGALTSRDSDYSPDTSSTNNRPRTPEHPVRRHAQKYDPDDDGGRASRTAS